MSFFGSGTGTGFTGFGAANQQQQQQQQPQQIRFGSPANATQGTTGFAFGQTTTPATGGMFGAVVQPQQQQQPITNTGFAFAPTSNQTTITPIGGGTTGFAFTPQTKPPESTGPGFSFGSAVAPANTSVSTGFGSNTFGAAPNVTATPLGTQFGLPSTTGFSFGSTAPSTGVTFGVANAAAAPSATPFGAGFGFKAATPSSTGLVASTAGGSLSFGQPAVNTNQGAVTATATPSFGFTGMASTQPSFGTGVGILGGATSTANSTIGFGMTPPSNVATIAPATTAPTPSSTLGSGFTLGGGLGTAGQTPSFNLGSGGGGLMATTVSSATTTPQNKGFSFGATANASPAVTGFSVTQPSSGSFQLGSVVSSPAMSSVPPVALTTTTLPLFELGKATSGTSLSTGGFLGLTPSTTTTPTATATSLGFSISQPIASTTPSTIGAPAPTGFGLPSTTIGSTPATTGFSFGMPAAKSTSALLFTSNAGTATTALGTSQSTQLTTTAAPTSTALAITPQPPTSSVATVPAATSSTISATAAAPTAALISFKKFEEDINKWTLELEEQERVFLSQATQVNAWDRILISNGDKITQLNDALERIKLDQEHLDQEIDFIRSQQVELEELLVPLEKSVESMPTISIHQHADMEREQTFKMAENIDSQLRLMSKDLKEIIDHLNSSTGNQDVDDPIQQIGKILNSHMDSLQWIDQNTAVLHSKIDELARVYENCRQDQQDSGMRLPYNL